MTDQEFQQHFAGLNLPGPFTTDEMQMFRAFCELTEDQKDEAIQKARELVGSKS